MMMNKIPNSRPADSDGLVSADLLGVRVDGVDQRKIFELVPRWARSRQRRTITYVNAHCLNLACADPVYRAILNAADLVYADGIGAVLASRLFGVRQVQKATGSEWLAAFCQLATQRGLRIYILAGKPGVAAAARQNLTAQWPGLRVVGVADGFFQGMTEAETLADIARTQPDILFVGMGTPRQEKWIARHRPAISAPVCWAVGSLFDLVAGEEPWPPAWVNALALQWLWRLLMDPLGKFHRYVVGNPVFIVRVLRQRLTGLGARAPAARAPAAESADRPLEVAPERLPAGGEPGRFP